MLQKVMYFHDEVLHIITVLVTFLFEKKIFKIKFHTSFCAFIRLKY